MNQDHNFSRLFALAAIASASVLAACASLGTPEDQSEGAQLWREMQGYQEWGHFDGHADMQKGKSPHGDYIVTYINAVAAQNPLALAAGSVVIKENFSSKDRGSLTGLTVMKKVEGYDPENGDWFWARYEPSGELSHAGKVAFCSDCHFDAGDDDFIFLND